jgi:hypothetical protein
VDLSNVVVNNGVLGAVDRRYFELCVFSNVMLELKSGDLCIPGSDQLSDYRKELASEDEFERGTALYGEEVGIPLDFWQGGSDGVVGIVKSTKSFFEAQGFCSLSVFHHLSDWRSTA